MRETYGSKSYELVLYSHRQATQLATVDAAAREPMAANPSMLNPFVPKTETASAK